MSENAFIRSHRDIASVHCISADAHACDPNQWQRPFIGIIASMHGNEKCGLKAIEQLLARAEHNDFAIDRGTLFLIHGNPAASAEGRRHTELGTDLNRLFDFSFVETLPSDKWRSEHHRALALRPLLSSLDVALDIHSATAPTPAFGIVSHIASSRPLARQLGLPFLTHGWNGPGLLGDRVMMQMLSYRDKPSIAVECGQHDDPAAIEQAHELVLHFLVAVGMLCADKAPTRKSTPALELKIVDAIKKPSPGFRFASDFVGFQKAEAGALIGSDDNFDLRSKQTCYLVMPNAAVLVGEDMVFLAHQIDPDDDTAI